MKRFSHVARVLRCCQQNALRQGLRRNHAMIKLTEHAGAAAKKQSSPEPKENLDIVFQSNAPDKDSYLWLEDLGRERTLAWAASQPVRTLGHFGGTQSIARRRPDSDLRLSRQGSRVHASLSVPLQFWQEGRKSARTVGPAPPLPLRRSCSPPRSGPNAPTRARRERRPRSCRPLVIPLTSK